MKIQGTPGLYAETQDEEYGQDMEQLIDPDGADYFVARLEGVNDEVGAE